MQSFGWGKSAIDTLTNSESNANLEEILSVNQEKVLALSSLPSFSHDLRLISAAGYPQYTNYVHAFKELLDYIAIESDKCEVIRIAPFPSEEILSEYTALPSKVFPSDHMAVCVDIRII